MLETDPTNLRALVGSLISSIYVLQDTNGETVGGGGGGRGKPCLLTSWQGFFFVFPDLSVRTEGDYRIKFSLMNVIMSVGNMGGHREEGNNLGHHTDIISHVISEPFRAYSAKKFPGMLESNDLMRCFANQGLKLVIRKDSKNRSQEPEEPEELEEPDDLLQAERIEEKGHLNNNAAKSGLHSDHRHNHRKQDRQGRRSQRHASHSLSSTNGNHERDSSDKSPSPDADGGGGGGDSSGGGVSGNGSRGGDDDGGSHSSSSIPPLTIDES